MVLAGQQAALPAHRPLMARMAQLALDLKRELESGHVESVGAILHENWTLKRQISGGVSDRQIDDWYAAGLASGAVGGKLLGAGRGGFLMFFAPPDRHLQIRRTLADLKPVTFRFDRTGAQIVFYHPSDRL
jgi:D-glycero-alpha-D-manno-heptose-7-phosphate kinase